MTTQPTPTLSIVSPLHNEAEGLAEFVRRTMQALTEMEESFEIILVDDGSTDRSWQQVLAAHTADPRVRGVRFSRNFGKEAAILAGLETARGAAVIVMDSDLQHPPALLPDLVQRWRAGAEVVETVKSSRTGQSAGMRLSARVFNTVFHRLTEVDLTDATDFRLLSRKAVAALLSLPERTPFFRATSTWIGFRREQIPFEVAPRGAGTSRWTLRSLTRMAINSISSFTAAPLHLVTIGAGVFGLFALGLGIQTLVRYLQGAAVTGFTTVILLLLIQGAMILTGLGVIGHYLARIHDEVKHRPRFLVTATTDPPGPTTDPPGPTTDPPGPTTESPR